MLLDFKKLLLWLKTEIRYSSKPVEALISSCQGSELCREAVNRPEFYKNPCLALETAGSKLFQNKEDRDMFNGFVSGLGTNDTQGQINHIKLYEGLAGHQLGEADMDASSRYKLYVMMGLFGGVTVSILLI